MGGFLEAVRDFATFFGVLVVAALAIWIWRRFNE